MLRISLPPLALITSQSVVAYALLDRKGQLLRAGELSIEQLAPTLSVNRVQAILHPDDAIVMTLPLPPLSSQRLTAAVVSSVEPLTLSDISELCIAHSRRDADGNVCVAWANRAAIVSAWRCIATAGLTLQALVPLSLALPKGDPHPEQALALPVDDRWLAPLPAWSLAHQDCRPATIVHRWRSSAAWIATAALIWIVGLNIYAAQLRAETRAIATDTERAIRAAFPSISLIIDPVRQVQNVRDQLRLSDGAATGDDFISLLLDAAAVMDFAEGQVSSLRYEDASLTIVLNEGSVPRKVDSALTRASAARALQIEQSKDDPRTWLIRRTDMRSSNEDRS